MTSTLLNTIASPIDVKRLPSSQLPTLCSELREVILTTVAQNGGHLSSNLGVVELTVALHRAFDSPTDHILFDVGHQCYAHKLLTGRQQLFHTLRQYGGLSGFPKPGESAHDAFHAGHSSTAISAGVGIAVGNCLLQRPGYTVVVVGDGALTGGLAYEGLNNAAENGRLIVVLNDNDNSISRNVGSVARYLSKTTSKPIYFKIKDATRKAVQGVPLLGKPAYRLVSRTKRLAKDAMTNSNFFENFGFSYFGPIDGHDIKTMTDVFVRARSIGRPALVHVKTQKGRGVDYAERNPCRYHGVSTFDALTGKNAVKSDTFSDVFGRELTRLAAADGRIVAITAAMQEGLALDGFEAAFPTRFFDVGIAEQHAVTFAAGLASTGLRPCFAVYASFLQRAYDQLVHDVALPGLPVVFGIDRAGLVGEDGDTHQGLFDLSLLNHIPGMAIYTPADYAQLRQALGEAFAQQGPAAVRYPRGTESALPPGRAGDHMRHYGDGAAALTLLTYGRMTANCIEAMELLRREGRSAAVLSLQRVRPVDLEALAAWLPRDGSGSVLFVEEGLENGGVGQQLLLPMLRRGLCKAIDILAVEDRFVPQGRVDQLMTLCGLDAQGIADRARRMEGAP
ncbi:MAG: 1-deoxy-D-xylulose-5-phosphate synthase [Clostridiales bacterium]|nr:1-deoxy-D-xylulose-5-phosphate synthase [Clostridiales bacterium]